ncbi:hypothetical protein [Gordonia phthalatica]|uniref:Pyrrolo-quinoline quinone n=1 Tax=Gordonia phthalatica TaxID=1136941 RepID=A0A0N9NIZ9_9ACTN|nr:hypothetical protein [Gordonia phthalatica]ALG85565.1 hypothetical protein ACH46_15135 [Gordonia phthalatica]
MGRIKPERRTRTDLIVTALIVVAVVVAGVAVWWTSSARQSRLEPATQPAPVQLPAENVPRTVGVKWSARSDVTSVPQITRDTVVTAADGVVTAHDVDGGQVWQYRRAAPLCAAAAGWPGGDNSVLAVYRNNRGCSEVTSLRALDGGRHGARTSDADDTVELSIGTDYALLYGPTRLETWGANLVRGIEYGRVDAPVNPDVSPARTHCRLYSALSGADRVAVVERCDDDHGYRLSVFSSDQTSDEKIRQWGSTMLTTSARGPAPRIIAATDTTIAVYDGGADPTGTVGGPVGPRIRLFTPQAESTGEHPVAGDPGAPERSRPINDQGVISFWTGKATVVLNASNGAPIFQVADAIGPGSVMAGQLLVPMPGTISVRRVYDGHEEFTIPVDRGDVVGPVSLRVLGDTIIEQRGTELVALR